MQYTSTSVVLALALMMSAQVRSQRVDAAAAAAYSEARNGQAFLVYSQGKLVFERYANGYVKTTPHRLASGTKSFSGVLAAMAVRDRVLASLDEKVADIITEWKTDPNKSKVTYRQLLSLSSGIDGGTNGSVPSYAASIQARTIAPPDTRFSYGPNPFQIFGEAMRRKLAPSRRSVADYIKTAILDPLGMSVGFWRNANTGEPTLPSGAFLVATEWAKFGDFLRRGGVAGTKRLLDERLLDECLRVASTNPNYRMTFWGPTPNEAGPGDLFYAAGAGKQRLYVSRELDLVVVRFGETPGAWSDSALLNALLPAFSETYGRGCAGSGGVVTIAPVGGRRPVLGTADFALRLENAPSRAFGVFVLGASRRRFLDVPLPLDFTAAGMPACSLYTSPDIILGFRAGAGGRIDLPAPIQNRAALSGKFVFVQAMIADARANAAGYTFSDAVLVRIGAR